MQLRSFACTFNAVLAAGLASFAGAQVQNTSLTAAGFSQFWGTSNSDYDLNGDGIVNSIDLSLFLSSAVGSSAGSSGGADDSNTALIDTGTPGAGTPEAAGTSAPFFPANAAGSEGVRLQPGGGFAGSTAVPDQVGDPTAPGASATSVARWDAIPSTTIRVPTNIGVTAFHMSGIQKVSFSANGGPWVDVTSMRRNPQTSVWEYFVTIDPVDFPDGPIEVRAIAWPNVGKARVLQGAFVGNESSGTYSLVVWNNRGGTLPAAERWVSPTGTDLNDGLSASKPMKTIAKAAASIQSAHGGDAGGGFINLLPGQYSWSGARRDEFGALLPVLQANERWLTVRAAPGSTAPVVFAANDSDGVLPVRRVAVQRVQFAGARPSRAGSSSGSLIWLANCDLTGLGTNVDTQWIDTSFTGAFLTQTRIGNCARGITRGLFARDVHIGDIGWDAFYQVPQILNSSVRNAMRPEGQTWHCDIVQLCQTKPTNPNENVIIYGLRAYDCRAQGLFARAVPTAGAPTWRNIAIVNCFLEFAQGSNHTSQWNVSVDHLLIWNSGFIGGTTMLRAMDGDTQINYANVSIQNSVFTRLTVSAPCQQAARAWRNHCILGASFGTDSTVGDALFVNAAENDYRPGLNSPLLQRVNSPLVPTDAALQVVSAPASIGAFSE